MTYTLHRLGSVESLEDDSTVLIVKTKRDSRSATTAAPSANSNANRILKSAVNGFLGHHPNIRSRFKEMRWNIARIKSRIFLDIVRDKAIHMPLPCCEHSESASSMMRLFFLVLARDRTHVYDKIRELENLGVPYKIVCGERLNHPNVVFRAPKGKYDAINFGASLIPKDADTIAMNDVDTTIHNFSLALRYFEDKEVALVFGTEVVEVGPQNIFLRFLNPIRKIIPIAASGELMFIRAEVLRKVLPLEPCKAEDTCILFRVLEYGYKTVFCEDCYARTERTKTAEKEEMYKKKTVLGIYQALSYTKPPYLIRLFYFLLPVACPILLIFGKNGYFWMKGILLGLIDFLRGDRSGVWQTSYME